MLKVLKPAKRSRSAPKTAGWRRQRQVVKRALDAIDPLPPARKDCQHDVIEAVRVIANIRPRESSGKMKAQLKATATTLRKARSALASLSGPLGYCVLVALDPPQTRQQALCGTTGQQFIGDLDRLIERCDDQAGKITPRRIQCLSEAGKTSSQRNIQCLIDAGELTTRIDEPKGGSKDARLDAARKDAAALGAFELLARYGDGFPKGKRFHTLASLLFEAAIGRAGVDCKAACLTTSKLVSRQDAFDERAWARRESPTTAKK
jgi:hypothetical protein